ncbi:hypothetical protein JA9_003517 [Meyerozyma sp. JA9]|nr:hypothetical protein JA9_003517 [Meyerozyma sp. JA9]
MVDQRSRLKRNRIPSTCAHCRVKKLRCDRAKPYCERCILDNCTDECVYDAKEMKENAEISTNRELLTRIKHYEDIMAYQKSLLDNLKQLQRTPGFKTPPSEVEPVKSGDVYNQRFDGYAIFESNPTYFEPTSNMGLILEDPALTSLIAGPHNRPHESCYNESDSVVPEITAGLGRLPPLRHIFSMLDRVFDFFSPFFHFFDKDSLLSQLLQLLKNNGEYSAIDGSKSNESSLIAILLLLLRLSSITMSPEFKPSNDSGFNINESYVECAMGLLMSPQSFKNIKFSKIQGLLLLSVYKMYCPEDDDTSFSMAIINAALVQSARVLGMHQPFEKYPRHLLDESQLAAWKKTWDFICYLDVSYAFDKGVTPVTHVSEIHSQSMAANSRKHEKITRLMSQCSKSLRAYLNGHISQREVNVAENEQLLKDFSDCLSEQNHSFRQLTTNNNSLTVAEISDKAREFAFRLDLVHKEFRVCFLLGSVNHASIKTTSLAFERSLILLRILHEKVVESRTFFTPEIDKLLYPRLWLGPRMAVIYLLRVIKRVMDGEHSILEYFRYFNSPDSTGLMDWIDIDFKSEQASLKKILTKLSEIYDGGFESSTVYYSCFKASMFMKYTLDYVEQKYPQSLIVERRSRPSAPFETILEGWMKKDEKKNVTGVESSLKSLNNELADFLDGMDEFWPSFV